jgi:hypothetical protein
MLFQSLEADKYISFSQNPRDGNIYLFDGVFTLRKMDWYQSTSFQMLLYKSFFSTFIFVCLYQPLKLALIHLDYRFKLFSVIAFPWRLSRIITEDRDSNIIKRIKFLIGSIAYINLLFFVAGRLLLAYKQTEFLKLIYGVNPIVLLVLSLPIISSGMTVILFFGILLIWKNKKGRCIQRVCYTLFAGAALMFIAFLNYWNLLGFRF